MKINEILTEDIEQLDEINWKKAAAAATLAGASLFGGAQTDANAFSSHDAFKKVLSQSQKIDHGDLLKLAIGLGSVLPWEEAGHFNQEEREIFDEAMKLYGAATSQISSNIKSHLDDAVIDSARKSEKYINKGINHRRHFSNFRSALSTIENKYGGAPKATPQSTQTQTPKPKATTQSVSTKTVKMNKNDSKNRIFISPEDYMVPVSWTGPVNSKNQPNGLGQMTFHPNGEPNERFKIEGLWVDGSPKLQRVKVTYNGETRDALIDSKNNKTILRLKPR